MLFLEASLVTNPTFLPEEDTVKPCNISLYRIKFFKKGIINGKQSWNEQHRHVSRALRDSEKVCTAPGFHPAAFQACCSMGRPCRCMCSKEQELRSGRKAAACLDANCGHRHSSAPLRSTGFHQQHAGLEFLQLGTAH